MTSEQGKISFLRWCVIAMVYYWAYQPYSRVDPVPISSWSYKTHSVFSFIVYFCFTLVYLFWLFVCFDLCFSLRERQTQRDRQNMNVTEWWGRGMWEEMGEGERIWSKCMYKFFKNERYKHLNLPMIQNVVIKIFHIRYDRNKSV